MTAEKKIAQKRLTLPQVAERNRNVSESCRRHSVSRSRFYEYKRAFQELDFDGLMGGRPIPKSFPKKEFGTKYKRLLGLEREKIGQGIGLTEEQIRYPEKANPCFRKRKAESLYPAYLLSPGAFYAGRIKGIGRIWLQAAVNACGPFAFGKLSSSKDCRGDG